MGLLGGALGIVGTLLNCVVTALTGLLHLVTG